jgi:hypothetical protein
MNRPLLTGLAFLALAFFACKKEETTFTVPTPQPIIQMGQMRWLRVGALTSYWGILRHTNDSMMSIETGNRVLFSEVHYEVMRFQYIPRKLGKHILRDFSPQKRWPCAGLDFNIIGDSGSGGLLYTSGNNPENYIEITHIHDVTGAVQGLFQFHANKSLDLDPDPNLPDSVRITKGVFHLIPQPQ